MAWDQDRVAHQDEPVTELTLTFPTQDHRKEDSSQVKLIVYDRFGNVIVDRMWHGNNNQAIAADWFGEGAIWYTNTDQVWRVDVDPTKNATPARLVGGRLAIHFRQLGSKDEWAVESRWLRRQELAPFRSRIEMRCTTSSAR